MGKNWTNEMEKIKDIDLSLLIEWGGVHIVDHLEKGRWEYWAFENEED